MERKPLLLVAASALLAAVLCAFPPAGLAQGEDPGTDTDEGSPVPDPTRVPDDDETGNPT